MPEVGTQAKGADATRGKRGPRKVGNRSTVSTGVPGAHATGQRPQQHVHAGVAQCSYQDAIPRPVVVFSSGPRCDPPDTAHALRPINTSKVIAACNHADNQRFICCPCNDMPIRACETNMLVYTLMLNCIAWRKRERERNSNLPQHQTAQIAVRAEKTTTVLRLAAAIEPHTQRCHKTQTSASTYASSSMSWSATRPPLPDTTRDALKGGMQAGGRNAIL